MSLIAEFSVPADGFALSDALGGVPGIRIEVERLATHSREWVMPFLWASGNELDAFEDALDGDPTVEEWKVLDRFEGTTLFVVRWTEPVESLVDAMIDRHAIVRRAAASDDQWFLEIQFADDEELSEFREHFEGDSFELRRKYRTTDPARGQFGLTPEQRETLVLASELGYFSVPREATVEDLADELGVSANSVSQRLRRAHDRLVHQTLVADRGRGHQ